MARRAGAVGSCGAGVIRTYRCCVLQRRRERRVAVARERVEANVIVEERWSRRRNEVETEVDEEKACTCRSRAEGVSRKREFGCTTNGFL